MASTRLLTAPKNARDGAQDRNLDVLEAAARLGVSKSWLYRHASKLPFVVRLGSRLLFSARGLDKWNQQQVGRASR
jgi:predicted DNA-binding transcriptional regulator AlpA